MEGNLNENSGWREKLIDDKNFDKNVAYDFSKLIGHFENINKDLDHINPYEFIAGIFEFTKAFFTLGSALSMGFSDITDKVKIWRALFKVNYTDVVYCDLQTVMEKEIQLNIHNLNGENNSKLGHKKGKSEYYEYTSGSRTIVRLSWFLNFLHNIFRNLLDTDDAFNSSLKKAYNEVLAPHHPWLVRKSVGVAFGFASSKRGPALKAFFGIIYFNFR